MTRNVWASFNPVEGGGVANQLSTRERESLARFAAQYRELLLTESQSSDPGMARLFPPAYRDDVLRNLDFDRRAHDDLLAARLDAIGVLEATATEDVLSQETATLWVGMLNDLRLVLGTRLGITADTDDESFVDDPDALAQWSLYRWLTHMVGDLLEALDPSLADVGSAEPPAGEPPDSEPPA